ncbi:unnamed protein product [Paramecium primaurelia]|uniref:Transmembrane protein n=1 Tax=Paramecium primaurelia TaxID=5886 RepID=A0A8S1QTE4_PARPR|nr:unnamed protein product [Paramecium primaurelia]
MSQKYASVFQVILNMGVLNAIINFIFQQFKKRLKQIQKSMSFGYFQLPDEKGYGYDCLECPSLRRTSSIYCVDCLFYPKTWYLKPVCKEDYKQNFFKYDDQTLVIKQRKPAQNDVYQIGNNKQINQYSEYEDYCQYSLQKNNYCHKVAHFHLGSQPTLKCKYNYLCDMVNQVCLRSNLICKTYDIQGHFIDCLTGMYLVWYYFYQCPNTCTLCQNN